MLKASINRHLYINAYFFLDILIYESIPVFLELVGGRPDTKTAVRLYAEKFRILNLLTSKCISSFQPTLWRRSRAKRRPDLKLAIFEVNKSDRRSEIRIIAKLYCPSVRTVRHRCRSDCPDTSAPICTRHFGTLYSC